MSAVLLTAGGRQHHMSGSGIDRNELDIGDIAHALSQINRFTGHAVRPYSVAEHSLLCLEIAERLEAPAAARWAVLMHDAHEAYTGDVSTPAKWSIGTGWSDFERFHCMAVRRRFGLQQAFNRYRDLVRHCDLVALATERQQLMSFDRRYHYPWPILDTPGGAIPPAEGINLRSCKREHKHWTEWRDDFLAAFQRVKADALQARVAEMETGS